MKEYLTQAIVLGVKPSGEFDRIVDFYTKDFGRLKARVVGGRKILSKFSPQLDILNLVILRLVKKRQFTVTDALLLNNFVELKKGAGNFRLALTLAFLIKKAAPELSADLRLWHHLVRAFQTNRLNLKIFLKLLGYDSLHARCENCNTNEVKYFSLKDQFFLCYKCHFQFSADKLLLI